MFIIETLRLIASMPGLTAEQIIERGPLEGKPGDLLWEGISPYLQAQLVDTLGVDTVKQIQSSTREEDRALEVLKVCKTRSESNKAASIPSTPSYMDIMSIKFAVEMQLKDYIAAEKTLDDQTAHMRADQKYAASPDRLKLATAGPKATLCFLKGDYEQAEELYAMLKAIIAAEPRLGRNSPQYICHLRGQIEAGAHVAKDAKSRAKADEVDGLIAEAWKCVQGMNRTPWAAFENEERTELDEVGKRVEALLVSCQ